MPNVSLRNMSGEQVGDIELRADVFEVKPNVALLHQVVVAENANGRQGNADTKNRAEVSGGGAKPFRQKGTGRARQGSIRSALQRHGGIVFGPTPRSYRMDTPKKMRRGAVRSALSARLADGDIIMIDEIRIETISTKIMAAFLKTIGVEGKILLVVDVVDENLKLSARNIPSLELRTSPAFSARDVLNADKIVMTSGAINRVVEVLG